MLYSEKSFDETWEQIHKKRKWGQYPSEDVIRFVARNYYHLDRSKMNILDFGCGAGANTWYLAKENFNVYAFDGSESAVERAKEKLISENLSAHFKVADALHTEYENDFFDCIIDGTVICLNPTDVIISLYKASYEMLKPGGKILSTAVTTSITGYSSGEELEKNTYKNLTYGPVAQTATIHFYESEKEVVDIFSKCNFENIKVDKVTRSDNGGKDIIEYYIVSASKPI